MFRKFSIQEWFCELFRTLFCSSFINMLVKDGNKSLASLTDLMITIIVHKTILAIYEPFSYSISVTCDFKQNFSLIFTRGNVSMYFNERKVRVAQISVCCAQIGLANRTHMANSHSLWMSENALWMLILMLPTVFRNANANLFKWMQQFSLECFISLTDSLHKCSARV